jgi:hypothetical protein
MHRNLASLVKLHERLYGPGVGRKADLQKNAIYLEDLGPSILTGSYFDAAKPLVADETAHVIGGVNRHPGVTDNLTSVASAVKVSRLWIR